MSERDVIKSFIDFAFMIKAQLHSEKTDLLRSILSISIMESEDLVEMIDEALLESIPEARHNVAS